MLVSLMRNLGFRRLASHLYRDTRGQDMIEYACLSAFVALTLGALLPNIGTSLGHVLQSISTVLANAADIHYGLD